MRLAGIPEICRLMTEGGDARIVLDPETSLNRYHSGPYPRDMIAFASSTANDLSNGALAHLEGRFGNGIDHLAEGEHYRAFLDNARDQIRAAYQLSDDIDIFFAPSGTDLEYTGMLAVADRNWNGISNLLLGSDEVGSGCVLSAAGCYFADETALGHACVKGDKVPGMQPVTLSNFPLRDEQGVALTSSQIAGQMVAHIETALATNQHPLVHIVHGSKTGLVLPDMRDIDTLIERFGDTVSFIVDACQARITSPAIAAYLERGIIVFLTGSKFMGGPPFSGFALLPRGTVAAAKPLASGMAGIFRQAEVPADWRGREHLEDSGNAGLALRLAASLHELDRFQNLSMNDIGRVVGAFDAAAEILIDRLDIGRVQPGDNGDGGFPVEKHTLVTLDLAHSRTGKQLRNLDFADAEAMHKALIARNIRLGQPVKSVRLSDGRWGATMRLGISMPQVVTLSALDNTELADELQGVMAVIADKMEPLLAS